MTRTFFPDIVCIKSDFIYGKKPTGTKTNVRSPINYGWSTSRYDKFEKGHEEVRRVVNKALSTILITCPLNKYKKVEITQSCEFTTQRETISRGVARELDTKHLVSEKRTILQRNGFRWKLKLN